MWAAGGSDCLLPWGCSVPAPTTSCSRRAREQLWGWATCVAGEELLPVLSATWGHISAGKRGRVSQVLCARGSACVRMLLIDTALWKALLTQFSDPRRLAFHSQEGGQSRFATCVGQIIAPVNAGSENDVGFKQYKESDSQRGWRQTCTRGSREPVTSRPRGNELDSSVRVDCTGRRRVQRRVPTSTGPYKHR